MMACNDATVFIVFVFVTLLEMRHFTFRQTFKQFRQYGYTAKA